MDQIDSDTSADAIFHPADAVSGHNDLEFRTRHYGYRSMVMEKDLAIPMRDGGVIFANVFRPHGDGQYPAIMSADLYGKDSIHVDVAARTGDLTLGPQEASVFTAWESPDPGFWVPNGYAVVKVGLRGSSGSSGHMSPMSDAEAEDYHDAIEWAAVQPWCDGVVGTNGVSYLAMVQWRVAQLRPPHLKAMIAWEGLSDLYREFYFHGGIPETNFARTLITSLRTRAVSDGSTVDDVEELQESRPTWDDYWAERRGDLSRIDVPLYAVAGWGTEGLHTRGAIQGFREASSSQKWLEIHGRKEWETYYGRESLERQKRFFDHFLKGADNDWLDQPRVRVEVRERFYDGVTRFASDWPLPETHYVPMFLDAAQGRLSAELPERPAEVSYSSDAEGDLPASADFSVAFDETTELTGHMKLRLWVSAELTDDLDLFVGLHKLDRRGDEVPFPGFSHIENGRVASGWLRVSHRAQDEARSTPYQPWLSHDRPEPVTPGEIVPVDIEIWPSSTLFRAGESIRLEVRGTEIPLTHLAVGVPNEQTRKRYEHEDTVNRGRHTLHTGGRYDSHLLLPVVAASPPAG